MHNIITPEQQTQESEYSLPYHYIPVVSKDGFVQSIHWSWGMRYLGGIELVLSELSRAEFSTLIDVGCGDGRFLKEVAFRFSDVKSQGVDYSKNAIALANALNPAINYSCLDITDGSIKDKFDVVTMVEVLEHIPVEKVSSFLESVSNLLGKDGRLIITVPHSNKVVSKKHFQHFSSQSLMDSLSQHFDVDKILPFDKSSRSTDWLVRLMGGEGKNYIVTNKKLNNLVYNKVLRDCLNPVSESNCCRLLAVAKLKK
jgi:cyclopropane fatty-acyl-phospholipid synthase-like methyltransferase